VYKRARVIKRHGRVHERAIDADFANRRLTLQFVIQLSIANRAVAAVLDRVSVVAAVVLAHQSLLVERGRGAGCD
jgi:hypothetical protein